MIQNYQYFLTLAETLNISHAAEKLFISHQCLSRYLKKLEEECGLMLFERKPGLTLTYGGELLLASFREIERAEQTARKGLAELKSGGKGEVRLGITEGRLRIFLPDLLKGYQERFPHVTLKAISAPTVEMLDQLLENKLDLVLGSDTGQSRPNLAYTAILEEEQFLVVSDNLLRQYFPEQYPGCKQTFAQGVDLRQFGDLPFCLLYRGFHSRKILEDFLQESKLSLRVIYEASQPDLLHIMTAHDYACSFCLSMYLPNIQDLNRTGKDDNQLYVFPVKGLTEKNTFYLISREETYFPQYTKALIQLIHQQCRTYQSWDK